MTITQITYARLKSTGDHEHERMEVAATLAEGENPTEAALGLRKFVEGSIDSFVEARDADRLAASVAMYSERPPFASIGEYDVVRYENALWTVIHKSKTTVDLQGLRDTSKQTTIDALQAYNACLSIEERAPVPA